MPVTLDSLRSHILKPQPGFYYEPRAYWDVITLVKSGPDGVKSVPGEVTLDSDNFYNSSKYPVILTELTVLPRIGTGSGNHPDANFDDMLIRIVSSGNQSLSRSPIPLSFLLGKSFEPPLSTFASSLSSSFRGLYDTPTHGPIWNTVQWDFHHPLMLPKDGAIDYSLGAMSDGVEFDNDTVPDTPAYMAFGESGDGPAAFFKGNARVHKIPTLLSTTKEGSPWVLNGGTQASNTTQVYPPNATIHATQYRRQNVTQAGSTALRSVSLTFDQRSWANNPDWEGDFPVGSIASAVPTKARTSGCGTGEWWWRPDAPASLVNPTRTPALVGKLPMPILLQPGDGLDISFMGTRGVTSTSPIGFSLTGFAAVEA